MFISGTGTIFDRLPSLEALRAPEARRNLSMAYLDAFTASINAQRSTGQTREEYEQYLRRLANSLESNAVFDPDVTIEMRLASAFVAAESLALLLELIGESSWGERSLENPFVFNTLEAALLYAASGFDANAAVLVKKLQLLTTRRSENDNETIAIDALVTICGGGYFSSDTLPATAEMILTNPTIATRSILLSKICSSIERFLRWRGGEDERGAQDCFRQLNQLIDVISVSGASAYVDVLHLSRILQFCLIQVSERAVRNIQVPEGERQSDYRKYLVERAKVRPVMWPTAIEYTRECLPGPKAHAVVNVPTGGGKSFIAEMAVSQAVLKGWALYLVPTNALAAQVRKDLEDSLSALGDVDVRAFLGGEEYTDLSTEQLLNVTAGTVVVMTPEKCALALRLSENAFASCQLCVFDECHLLGEGSRGALAELVLSHIIVLAPDCKFLLMSAMLSNTEELAQWIAEATARTCISIKEPWRPTRTMRGLLGVIGDQALHEYRAACKFLRENPKRKTKTITMEHAVLTNLQGIWGSSQIDDYAMVKLPFSSSLKVEKRGNRFQVASWINTVATSATRHFADKGHTVLTFLPANKHFAFSVGKELSQRPPVQQVMLDTDVGLLLNIAEDELGGASVVRELLVNGVAVHTARLLDSEKEASELCFRRKQCNIMLATGTLAQGLNLPATVVLIGGTVVGDIRKADDPDQRRNAKAQLLNALGRAARAGYANQGISLLIPDRVTMLTSQNRLDVTRDNSDILAEDENSTRVTSRLEGFLQSILEETLTVETASEEHLTALSYLPITEGNEEDIEKILGKTLAVRLFPEEHRREFATLAKESLTKLGMEYVTKMGAPSWLPTVSYRTGLSLGLCIRTHKAFCRASAQIQEWPQSILEWANFFFDCLNYMTPRSVRQLLGEKLSGVPAELIWDEQFDNHDDPDWLPPAPWSKALSSIFAAVKMYMTGGTIGEIGKEFLDAGEITDFARTSGKPIPKTLNLVKHIVDRLAQCAGALIVLEEQTRESMQRYITHKSKLSLASLPLAVKYGCDSRSSLGWYRFGVRFRRPAHLLADIMPIPNEDMDDDSLKVWIRRSKAEFLILDLEELKDVLSKEEFALIKAVQGLEA